MKDNRHHYPDFWTAVAVHHDPVNHHHNVTHAKWSAESQSNNASQSAAKRGWPVFRNEHRPSLASISTDRQPLIPSETTIDTTGSAQSHDTDPWIPFSEKYGRCLEILHYGTNSTVRLHQVQAPISGLEPKQLCAVKVYRYNIVDSSKSIHPISSSCSSSAISGLHPHHANILPITDLLYNDRSELCLVMPFCAGGDLHELISRSRSPIPTQEADCILTQILRALSFLHENDTAHRDIRLETILLTENGAVKLAGFGDGHIRRIWSECAIPSGQNPDPTEDQDFRPRSHSLPSTSWSFSLPWLFSSSRSTPTAPPRPGDVAGSSASFPGMSLPYIPPEGFHSRGHGDLRRGTHSDDEDRDPRPADVWATAIIYLTMITGRLIWRSARPQYEDSRYLEYLRCRCSEDGYPPIEALGSVCSDPPYQ